MLLFCGLIIFFASITQTLSGFGFGLVSMALLPTIMPIDNAVPLVSMMGILVEVVLIFRFRHALTLRRVLRLTLASVVGIPIGIFMLNHVDLKLLVRLLGIFVGLYALYGLFNFPIPHLENRRWAYPFGFVGGFLSGLYNIPGPSFVIYGTTQGWTPDQFRGNLQGLFLVNSIISVVGHSLNGAYTAQVGEWVPTMLAGSVAGIFCGLIANRLISPQQFRKLVLIVLLVLSVRLVMG